MVQVVIVLHKTECLDEILKKFVENNIPGGTILDGHGMARSVKKEEDNLLMSMLKDVIDFEDDTSKVMFMIVEENQIRTISQIVNEVTGGLQNPNTGIMFCTPVVYIEGLRKNKK